MGYGEDKAFEEYQARERLRAVLKDESRRDTRTEERPGRAPSSTAADVQRELKKRSENPHAIGEYTQYAQNGSIRWCARAKKPIHELEINDEVYVSAEDMLWVQGFSATAEWFFLRAEEQYAIRTNADPLNVWPVHLRPYREPELKRRRDALAALETWNADDEERQRQEEQDLAEKRLIAERERVTGAGHDRNFMAVLVATAVLLVMAHLVTR